MCRLTFKEHTEEANRAPVNNNLLHNGSVIGYRIANHEGFYPFIQEEIDFRMETVVSP